MSRSDTETIIIPGKCAECGCEVTPDNVGFECDEFCVCQKCVDETKKDYDNFLIDQTKEENEI